MASKKIDYRLKEVFREARSMAHAIRWQYIFFLGILFTLFYVATQIVSAIVGTPSTPRQAYFLGWIILPIVIQFLAALYISAVSYTMAFKKFMMGKAHVHNFFDYFTKIFAISILVFYISHCLYVIFAYPSISTPLQAHHPFVFLCLFLLSFVAYLLVSTFLIFSFFHVLFGEHSVVDSLKASCRQVKPHWHKVFMLTLAFMFGISIPYALVHTGFTFLNVSDAGTVKILDGILLGAIGAGLLVWLSPILLAAFLISYKKLALNTK